MDACSTGDAESADACDTRVLPPKGLRESLRNVELTIELWKNMSLENAVKNAYHRNNGSPNLTVDEIGYLRVRL